MSFIDPGAATDASAAGGKGGGVGGGDPFAAFSGLGGGLGDVLGGGLGLGGVGDTAASPGGDISQVASAQGDPTGAVQAQQSVQAGAPTPNVPGGGIGGAQSGQSGATQPFNPAVGFSQQPAEATTPAGYKAGPTTGQPMDPNAQVDQSVPKATSQDSGNLTQSQFDQRFQDPSFTQRFGTQNMAPGGNMAPTLPQLSQTQLAMSGMANPPPGVTNIPGGVPAATPNVDTPTAGPATPTTTGAGTPAAPAATADTTDTTESKPAGTKPAGADTTDASSTGADRQAGGGLGGGRGGIPGMPNINPLALISALLRGGPRAALGELARQAMSQGMMNPSMPGGGAPGRGYSPGGTGRAGADEGPEAPETPDTAQQPLTPEQQQQQQAAAAGQPAPGVTPSATGLPQAGLPTRGPEGGTPSATPPAWAQAAAGMPGAAPNTTATQNASLGGGNLPATGNAQVDRWVSPQHVQMSRLAGTNTPPTPGYSSTMRDARAPYMDQITPRDRTLLYGMMNAENARDPIGPMESLANRAVSSHMSIHQLLNSGFYGPRASFLRRGLAIQNSGQAGHYDSVINAVRRGSNVLGGATDQGSGRDPNVGWRGGRVLRSGEVYNDWGGGRGHNANRQWREQIQARVRAENAANPPRPPAPIPTAPQGRMPVNIRVNLPQRAGEGSPIEAFGPGSMGRGRLEPAGGWRRSSIEDVNAPTFGQRFQGDVDPEEARVRKANYEASLPSYRYQTAPSQLADALGLGDIRLDQITQLLSQLQASPPQ